MDFVHHLRAVQDEHLRRRAIDTTLVWAVNATNATLDAHDPQQDVSPLSESQLHQALLRPWVLGVVFQSILMGVLVSQAHNLYLSRAHLSCKTAATTALLFCTNMASFGTQSSTLWFFSMSSLGDVQFIMMQRKLRRR